MDNDIKTWLYDILQSINEIESYYEDKPKKFKEFVADIKTNLRTGYVENIFFCCLAWKCLILNNVRG